MKVSAKPKCWAGKQWNNVTEECECPTGRPHFTGEACVACVEPEHWDQQLSRCAECADGLVYNATQDACVACPSDKPVERDGACLACPDGTHFEEAAGLCIKCSEGSSWNAASSSCEEPPKIVCEARAVFNATSGQCEECPANSPLVVDGKCLACPERTHFVGSFGVCIQCGGDNYYDAAEEKCKGPVDVSFPECSAGASFDPLLGECVCPTDKPFDDGAECQ